MHASSACAEESDWRRLFRLLARKGARRADIASRRNGATISLRDVAGSKTKRRRKFHYRLPAVLCSSCIASYVPKALQVRERAAMPEKLLPLVGEPGTKRWIKDRAEEKKRDTPGDKGHHDALSKPTHSVP